MNLTNFSYLIVFYLVFSPLSWDWTFIQLLLPLAIFIRFSKKYHRPTVLKYQIFFILGLLPLFVPNNIELLAAAFGFLPHTLIFRSILYSLIFLISFSPLLYIYFLKKISS